MREPQPIVGAPGPAPEPPVPPSVMSVRSCGCWFMLHPDDPPISEFTCEHGYFVGRGYVV